MDKRQAAQKLLLQEKNKTAKEMKAAQEMVLLRMLHLSPPGKLKLLTFPTEIALFRMLTMAHMVQTLMMLLLLLLSLLQAEMIRI